MKWKQGKKEKKINEKLSTFTFNANFEVYRFMYVKLWMSN
jgi:hypothetical protein